MSRRRVGLLLTLLGCVAMWGLAVVFFLLGVLMAVQDDWYAAGLMLVPTIAWAGFAFLVTLKLQELR